MTVERTEKYEFCSVKQNTVEEFEFECSRCGQKFSLKSDTSVVKATTRPRSAIRNVIVALSFLVSGQYFKDYHKILWTLKSGPSQFDSVDPHCWMACAVRKTDRRLERERSENWSNPTGKPIIITHPVRRLLSDSRPLFQQQLSSAQLPSTMPRMGKLSP